MSPLPSFNLNVVVKGLFVAVPDPQADPGNLMVLLVDARNARASSFSPGPLFTAEHRPILEFLYDDWIDRRQLPHLVRVIKRAKGEVGLFPLVHRDISLATTAGPLSGGVQRQSVTPELPRFDSIEPGTGAVKPELLLPGPLSAGSGNPCVARARFTAGSWRADRPSVDRAGNPQNWRFTRPADPSDTGTSPRRISLDLIVTTTIPADEAVVVTTSPYRQNTRDVSFQLRPRRPGGELTVWVKNRELDVILAEEDGFARERCAPSRPRDIDFELLYDLMQQPGGRRIPVRQGGSGGGCCCGGGEGDG